MEVKHGGCADCGSKEQEFLESIYFYGQRDSTGRLILMGSALCKHCIAKREKRNA